MPSGPATPVCFSPFKYGRALSIDSTPSPCWTGIVADGQTHVLDFHELLLVQDGAAAFDIDGDRRAVRGPAVILTRPHLPRRVEVDDPLRLHLVVFADAAVKRLGAGGVLGRMPSGVVAQPTRAELARFTAVAELMTAELLAPRHDSALLLEGLLVQLLVLLGRSCRDDRATPKPALLMRFERLLEQRFREEHRLAAYAESLGVTPDHLSATVRQYVGGSAKTMIDHRLMREGAHLLLTTDTRIADIAGVLGYEEPSHFARAFKRLAGISPARFRSTR